MELCKKLNLVQKDLRSFIFTDSYPRSRIESEKKPDFMNLQVNNDNNIDMPHSSLDRYIIGDEIKKQTRAFSVYLAQNCNVSLSKIQNRAKLYEIAGRSTLKRENVLFRLYLYENSELNADEWHQFLGEGWIKRVDGFGYQNENNSIIVANTLEFENFFHKTGDSKLFLKIPISLHRLIKPSMTQIKTTSEGITVLKINQTWYSIPYLSQILHFLFPRTGFRCYQHETSNCLYLRTDKKAAILCPMSLDDADFTKK